MNLLLILRTTFAQLAASKKVVTAFSTLTAAVLATLVLPTARKYGLPIDENAVQYIVGGILGTGGVTILGQGLQDKGKTAAVIAAIDNDPDVPTTKVLAAQGLLGLPNETLISLGVAGLIGQVKDPSKRAKIRKSAAEVTKQSLIAFRDDEEFMRVVRPYFPE